MRENGGGAKGCLAAVVLIVLTALGGPICAGELQVDHEVILGVGVDSNPLRVTGDGENGAFAEVRYDVALDQPLTTRLAWFLDADGNHRSHETRLEDGDFQDHFVRLGLEVVPSARPITFGFGGLYGLERRPYLDPATGDPYRVDADILGAPPGGIAIPERYDRDWLGPFFNVDWNMTERLRLFLRSEYVLVSYIRDYDEVTTLEPLDYDELRVEPGVRWRLTPVVLNVSVILRERDYDASMARDENGDSVPGTRRRYRYGEGRVRLLIEPLERWRFTFDVRIGQRDDTFDGYYDYSNVAAFARAEWKLRPKINVQLLGLHDDRSYAHPLDPLETENESQHSTLHRWTGRVRWDFRPKIGLFVETGLRQSQSRDPLYDYDEAWSFAGVRFAS